MEGYEGSVPAENISLIEETFHSKVMLAQRAGGRVVIKHCRNPGDPRTKTRFDNEVAALEVAGRQVRYLSLILAPCCHLTLL